MVGLVRAGREQQPRDTGAAPSEAPPSEPALARKAGRSPRQRTPRPTAQVERRRLWPPRPAVAGVVIAGVVVAGAIGALTLTGLRPGTVATAPASGGADTTFPSAVAPGWSRTARWVSPPVETGGGKVLALDDAIAYVTAEHRLRVVDAVSGAQRWEAELPAGAMSQELARTTIAGAPVVAAQVGDTLAWWNTADGKAAGTVQLPAGARVSYLGAAPLIGLDERTVAVVGDGALRRVTVPSGAFPLAADAAGQVSAASGRGWWHLRPGVAASAVRPWESAAPDDEAPSSRPGVVGYLGGTFLTLYPPDRSGRRHVVASTDGQAVRVSFRGQVTDTDAKTDTTADATADAMADATAWWPSPSGTWGVLGRTLVDLERGSVTDLGAWRTTWITADRAYGTIDGRSIQVGPQVPRTEVGTALTIPEVVGPAGAVLRAKDAQGERLYLLPPTT